MDCQKTDITRSVYIIQDAIDILFADDDPILREFAEVHLSTDQATVRTAADGKQAMEMAQQSLPDVILLDLEMPELNGFEVLDRLAHDARLSRVPVIVVTGREDTAAIDQAYRAGATSFVVKPLNWRQLAYQVRYVHRTATNEHTLEAAHDHARAKAKRLQDQLGALVAASASFVAAALERHPDLNAAAASYAKSAAAAVGPDRPSVRRPLHTEPGAVR